MRKNLKLRIFFSIFITVAVIYLVAITLIIFQVQSIFNRNLKEQTHQLILANGKYFYSVFDKDLELLRALKNSVQAISDEPYPRLVKQQKKIFESVMYDTPQFLSLAISWELHAIKPNYIKTYGRYRYLFYWSEGKIIQKIDTLNIDDPGIGSLYYIYKTSKRDDVTDIYYDTYTGREEDKQLMASLGVPILKNGVFEGLVSCDISLKRFNKVVNRMKPFPEAQSFLVSQTGKIVANSTGKYINEPLDKILSSDVTTKKILLKLEQHKHVMYTQKDSLGNKNIVMIEPFYFGKIQRAWGIGIIVPLKVIRRDANRLISTAFVLAFIGFFLLLITIIFIVNSIILPINKAVESIEKIASFDISEDYKVETDREDELGRIQQAVNSMIDSLLEIKQFTSEISKGNLEYEYKAKNDRDIIGKSLIEMQRNLKIADLESKRREKEELIQRWTIEGETKVAKILRDYSQDVDKLYYEIVSFLVRYTKAVQGAIFVVDTEEQIIELAAAYAEDRRKYLTKKIPFGVGLIGRSYKEGETIYLTDVPKGYSSISSGLGEEEPRSVLIVPFKFNDIIYAIVELNSFHEFKKHERQFVERVGVSVASTIANINVTLKTNRLVEELRENTREMETRDEEMRQNIEEMQSTQEELIKKVNEYEGIVSALNQVSFVAEYNLDKELININNKFLLFLGKSRNEMIGKKLGSFSNDEEQTKKLYELWKEIEMGRLVTFTQKIVVNNRTIVLAEAYIPIFDENGRPFKVINIANDITSHIEKFD
jgi:methyl-accepting chemotaxis protein